MIIRQSCRRCAKAIGRKEGIALIIALFMFIPAIVLAAVVAAQKAQGTTPAPIAHARKANLEELYAMFFIYAAHVESRSIADEASGKDRSIYRQHLQQASGLTAGEYALVLASAIRYAQADANATAMLQSLYSNNPQGDPPAFMPQVAEQANAIMADRQAALENEITNVRASLGNERAGVFESYLLNSYDTHPVSRPLPQPIATNHISTDPPYSSTSFSFPPGTQIQLQMPAPAASAQDSATAQGSSAAADSTATPDEATATGAQQCVSGYTAEYSGYYTICADSELYWIEGNQVEPYAEMYATWGGYYAFNYLEIQGYFYVNGIFDDDLGCHNWYFEDGSYVGNTSCQHEPDVQLDSPSGTIYDWAGVTSIGIYDGSCVTPEDCYETTDSVTSDGAEVQIFYPTIASISPTSVAPGNTNQTLIIYGANLVSPFQNPPSVTVSNQGQIFSSFSVQSYSAGSITIGYSVSSSAPAGNQTLTVNNGFGSASINITVTAGAPPPQIMFNGQNISGTTQSVVAGQQIALSVSAPAGYSIENESWSFSDQTAMSGGYSVSSSSAEELQDPPLDQPSLTFYWMNPNDVESVSVSYTLDNGENATSSATFDIDGPTGITVANEYPVASVAPGLYNETPYLEVGTGISTPPTNYGVVLEATAAHLPSASAIGTNASLEWAQILIQDQPQIQTASGTEVCAPNAPLPALDTAFPTASVQLSPSSEEFADSPAIPLLPAYGETAENMSFNLYLLWDPALPSGCVPSTSDAQGNCTSIPVPLGELNWGWSGDAINTLVQQSNQTTYSLNCGDCDETPTSFVLGGDLPEWQYTSGPTPFPGGYSCQAQ